MSRYYIVVGDKTSWGVVLTGASCFKISGLGYIKVKESKTVDAIAEEIFTQDTPDEVKDLYFKLNGSGKLKAGEIVIIASPKIVNEDDLEELKRLKSDISRNLAD